MALHQRPNYETAGHTGGPSTKRKLYHPELYIHKASGDHEITQACRYAGILDSIKRSDVIVTPLSKCMGVSK